MVILLILILIRIQVCGLRFEGVLVDIFQSHAGLFRVQSMDYQEVDLGVRGLGDAVRAHICNGHAGGSRGCRRVTPERSSKHDWGHPVAAPPLP